MLALYFEVKFLLQLPFVFTFCINHMQSREYNGITYGSMVSGISSTWGRNWYQKAAQNAVPPQLHCFLSCAFPPCFLPWKLEMLFLQQVNQGSCKQHTSVFLCMGPSSTVVNVVIPLQKKQAELKWHWNAIFNMHVVLPHLFALLLSDLSLSLFIPSFHSLQAPSTSLWYFASAMPLLLHFFKPAVDKPWIQNTGNRPFH